MRYYDIPRMESLRRSGCTLTEIAAATGVSVSKAGVLLTGIKRPKLQHPSLTPIKVMRATGMTLAQIGKDIGLTTERVRQIMVAAGVSTKRIKRDKSSGEEFYKLEALGPARDGKQSVMITLTTNTTTDRSRGKE